MEIPIVPINLLLYTCPGEITDYFQKLLEICLCIREKIRVFNPLSNEILFLIKCWLQ